VTNLKAYLAKGTRGARIAGRKLRGSSTSRRVGASTTTSTIVLGIRLAASILEGLGRLGSKIGSRSSDIRSGESLLVNTKFKRKKVAIEFI
jgi:hypothetical protein